jgi:hypothetical protein
MKKLLLAAILLVLSSAAASAQESWTLNATANQVTDVSNILNGENLSTCARLALADGCTQAQACTAANAAGGSSCTAGQARTANARIWPQTQPGREEFVTFFIAAPRFLDLKGVEAQRARRRYCEIWWPAQSQGTKDAECAKLARNAGCEVCS